MSVLAEQAGPSRRPTAPPGGGPFDPAELGLGVVVPVLGAHSQAGTSGVALAVADAAAATGRRVLLVDCADPARSGLAGVCAVEGRSVRGDRRAAVRLASRRLPKGVVDVRRPVGTGEPVRPEHVPSIGSWVTADANGFDLTVVDVGWDVWALTASDASPGPLAWATGSAARTFPVLVMRPTAASVALAEGVLTRYHDGVRRLGLADLHCLAVVGGTSWPARTRAVMGLHLARLARRTLFVPASPDAAVNGWTTEPAPTGSVRAGAALLKTLTRTAKRRP
ncbi:hypothetical protein [Virgisporangium ochraceum]|uniref:Uncharacterized protein n=1 Tax=Virgisporangium ochraceum TaxID=65505 RepID=A0A8J4EDH8_9ACTN|nr:hypothetical protein [Virgisporangium ochraceum]GIJ70603.1 hypothetical protein Voc01_055200 [Virgisporangium ochraceum]